MMRSRVCAAFSCRARLSYRRLVSIDGSLTIVTVYCHELSWRCEVSSPGELMGAAVERTGLTDFGDDSFREGLEILTTALRDEARLNDRGAGFIYARIGLHLRQRLQ